MAQEFIGSISGIGDAANNINVIDGQMDAAFIDMLLGGGNDNIHAGVVKDVLGSLRISPMPSPTANTSSITLKSGIAFAYGYKGKMDADMTFTIPRPVTADVIQYYWIVMQFDTTKSPNVCKVFLDYQGTDSTYPTYRTDNLLKTHGVYNLVLYRLDVLLSSTTSFVVVKVNSFYTEFDKPHRASTVDYVTTQPEGTKNTTPASTEFVNNVAVISERTRIISSSPNNCYANFNKIGRNVIASFDIYFGGTASPDIPTLAAFNKNTALGKIANNKLYPKNNKTFTIAIIDVLDKGTNHYDISINKDGYIVAGGQVNGVATSSMHIYSIIGTVMYNLDD